MKARVDRFESTSIGPVVLWDDPGFRPARGPRPDADSVVFSGTGTWNGASGFTFEARAEDEGEPGRGRDVFELTIRDSTGTIVVSIGGVLTEGNIQSQRLRKR